MHAPARGRRILGLSVAVAAAAATAACSASTPGSPPVTVTVTPSSASPATTAPATSAPAPARSASPSAGTSSAVAAPYTTASLRVSKGANNGAAGTIYTNIDFTNTSGSACVLEGYPGVSLVRAGSNAGTQIGDAAKRDHDDTGPPGAARQRPVGARRGGCRGGREFPGGYLQTGHRALAESIPAESAGSGIRLIYD